ncbi:MAG TPA: hypothetical protein VGN20_28860 [Mucilaginibacter sp.]|jgi:hypothetical protein
MTILKITVEDAQADLLIKFLQEVSFVTSVEVEHISGQNDSANIESRVDSIKTILEEAKGKNLFENIKDPVEWQREIRKDSFDL